MYNLKTTATALNIKLRTLQNKCREFGYSKVLGKYSISNEQLIELADWFYPDESKRPAELLELMSHSNTVEDFNRKRVATPQNANETHKVLSTPKQTQEEINEAAIETVNALAMKQGLKPTYYTDEEYTELVGRLAKLEILEEQVQELKEQNKELREMLKDGLNSIQKALSNIGERNYIEAKEKGVE